MEPLTFGESAQLFQAYRAYALITTGQTTGTIAVPAGATLLRKMVISVSENATRSVAGVTQFSIGTGADTMFSVGLYFPTSQTSASGAAYSRDIVRQWYGVESGWWPHNLDAFNRVQRGPNGH